MQEKEKTVFDQIKAQNGEAFAKAIRSYHNGIFDIPNIVNIVKYAGREAEPILQYLKSLDTLKIDEHAVYETPFQLLNRAGYDAYYADTLEKQNAIQKYYASDEKLCTFNDPSRYSKYYIVNAVKKNVNDIKRENFTNPKREDEYGTSVLSIQILKKGNFISIKNRYNHTVTNPDNTFDSDPDRIIPGLSEALQCYFNVDFSATEVPLPEGYLLANGQIIKYNKECNNVYFGDDFYFHDGIVHEIDKRTEIMIGDFIYNNETKDVLNPTNVDDAFIAAFRQEIKGKKIRIDKDKKTKHTLVFADGIEILDICEGNVVALNFPSVTEIGDNFLRDSCSFLETVNLPSVQKVGESFLSSTLWRRYIPLKSVNLPNLVQIGGEFLKGYKPYEEISLTFNKLRKVTGNLDLSAMNLTKLPNLSDVIVMGDFDVSNNPLISLEGCPKEVWGDFGCHACHLISLKGAPHEVGGCFVCSHNKLISLEGAPREINDNFDCSSCCLGSLKGAPEKVGGNFFAYFNRLTSLEGAPKEVVFSFVCRENPLNSLDGAPEKIGGSFDCSFNNLNENSTAPEYVFSYGKIVGISEVLSRRIVQNYKKLHGQSGPLNVVAKQVKTKGNVITDNLSKDKIVLINKINTENTR